MKQKSKIPLWMIVLSISFAIPVLIILMVLPSLGAIQYNLCEAAMMGGLTDSCEFPPNYMYIIIEGMKWAFFLDALLVVWAYLSWKWDYLIPWLKEKFYNEDL